MKLIAHLVFVALLATPVLSQARPQVKPAPDRRPGEGEGPFERLIIRGATLIDGTGAPPRGPVDIVIEGKRIVQVRGVGVPKVPMRDGGRPGGATRMMSLEISSLRCLGLAMGFLNSSECVHASNCSRESQTHRTRTARTRDWEKSATPSHLGAGATGLRNVEC